MFCGVSQMNELRDAQKKYHWLMWDIMSCEDEISSGRLSPVSLKARKAHIESAEQELEKVKSFIASCAKK